MVFVELFRRGFRQNTAYRAANLAGFSTNTLFGFVHGAILVAAVRATGHGSIAGYDVQSALTFAWIGQALIAATAVFRWTAIAERVQTGAIATDLARPYDFQKWWCAVDLGRAASAMIVRGIPQYLIGAVFFTLARPDNFARWLLVIVSVALGITVSFGLRFVANLLVFWTVDARGVNTLQTLLMVGLSGLAVPLNFFPAPWNTVLRSLPWAAMVQTPADVFMGRPGMGPYVLAQALWIIGLFALGRLLLTRATRLVVQGG